MGFTVEDRYLRLTTSTTLKVLHLPKKENHRLTAVTLAMFQHISNFNYQVQSAPWSVVGAQYLAVD